LKDRLARKAVKAVRSVGDAPQSKLCVFEAPKDLPKNGKKYKCGICQQEYDMDDQVNKPCNIGNKNYPKYADGGCANAMRRFVAACDLSIPSEKMALTKLRRNKEQFYLKIIQLKHSHTANETQKGACRTLFERVVVWALTQSVEAVEMMDRDAFLAHQIYQRNQTPERAASLWTAELDNQDNHTETVKGITFLAVEMNKRFEFIKGIKKERELANAPVLLNSEEAKESGLKRLFEILDTTQRSSVFGSVGGAKAFASGNSEAMADVAAMESDAAAKRSRFNELTAEPVPLQNTSTDISPVAVLARNQKLILAKQTLVARIDTIVSAMKTTGIELNRKLKSKAVLDLDVEILAGLAGPSIVNEVDQFLEELSTFTAEIKNMTLVEVDSQSKVLDDRYNTSKLKEKKVTELVHGMGDVIKDQKEEKQRRKKADTKLLMSAKVEAIKIFDGSLPKTIGNFIGMLIVEPSLRFPTLQIGRPPDVKGVLNFSSVSAGARAIWSALDIWKANWDTLKKSADDAVNAQTRAILARAPLPKAGKPAAAALVEAAWYPALIGTLDQCLVPLIPKPTNPELCLPFYVALNNGVHASGHATLPFVGFSQWIINNGAVGVMLVLVSVKVSGTIFVHKWLAETKPRLINTYIDNEQIFGIWLEPNACVFLNSGWAYMVVNPNNAGAGIVILPHIVAPEIEELHPDALLVIIQNLRYSLSQFNTKSVNLFKPMFDFSEVLKNKYPKMYESPAVA
jgi:hypothetical protein